MNSLETVHTTTVAATEKTVRDWGDSLAAAIRAILWIYVSSLLFRPMLVIERNGFLVLLALLVLWSMSQKRFFYRPTSLDLPLFAFVGWIAVTIPFAQFPAYSLKEFGKLLQGVVVFYAVLYFLGNAPSRKKLVYLMVGLTALVSIYGLAQYNPSDQQAMKSFLPSEVWLTTALVLLIPLSFGSGYGESSPWLRGGAIAVGLIAVACLVLTRSRAGTVSVVIELVLLVWLLRRWKIALLAAFSALVCIGGLWLLSLTAVRSPEAGAGVIPMNKSIGSVIHRFDIWTFTLAEIQKHPFVGIGYGKDNYLLVYGTDQEQVEPGHNEVKKAGTHNILLYYALHTGIPGLLFFAWLLVAILRTLARGIADTADTYSRGILIGVCVAVVGMMVRLQFDHMFVGTLAVLFWLILAIGFAHLSREKAGTYR